MRALIAIGCNAYQNVDNLDGAETDAQRMFNALIRADIGDYSASASCLLLSPTIEEVRTNLRRVLFENGSIDTFTFFFAGHGGVRFGSFYMWVCDTDPDAQSMTALPLSDLFRSLNEVAPKQSNIIIDACESGGLITDLGTLLKSSVLGNADTPGITLLATSAQDQTSGENASGGFGTNAILDCIEGRDFIQDNSNTLDLVEIGRHVSIRLRDQGQNPVVWGLNLYGPPRFCLNPRRASDPAKPLRNIVQTWPQNTDTSIREHYDKLWDAYASVSSNWNSRSLINVIAPILSSLMLTPQAMVGFIERFGVAILERSETSHDMFRRAEVSATLAVSLLPYIDDETVNKIACTFIEVSGDALLKAGLLLEVSLVTSPYGLLEKHGSGLNELFYLPLRVTKILGWMAVLTKVFPETDSRSHKANELFANSVKLILEKYGSAIVAMSDEQAPYLAAVLSVAEQIGLREEAENIIGMCFNSLVGCSGQLARCSMPPDQTLKYILARASSDYSQVHELIERPIETLTVLLKSAALLDLDTVLDEELWRLDGLSLMAYVNSDISSYSSEVMSGGKNLIWRIGHDIFKCEDMIKTWPETEYPKSESLAILSIFASFLYPDRIPWQCLGSAKNKT